LTNSEFKQACLSLPNVEDKPHFDRIAFKISGKRIFATLFESAHSANIRLNLDEQRVFSNYEEGVINPVPNKWGEQGWTTFELDSLPSSLINDALNSAHLYAMKNK